MVDPTCWTLIESAAAGHQDARSEFAARYLPVVRAYLQSRWKGRLSAEELEDAVQEVFVECLRERGVLARLLAGRKDGFRSFLLGVVRNVALRVESSRRRRPDSPQPESFHPEDLSHDERSVSRAFDRAWATTIMREAARRQADGAQHRDEDALRRVELLRLVFQQGRSIQEIAEQWRVPAPTLHHEYARARREFQRALEGVIAFHHPGAHAAIERECRELLSLLE